jgi:signal transduction histidine kinase
MVMPSRPAIAGAEAPRRTLRRKGIALFVAVSAYVVAGAAFVAWQGVALADGAERTWSLLGAATLVILGGLAVFGAFLTRFLGRLAADLGRLQVRALEVANGLRAAPLAIERDDEVGALARAVDKMAADLQAREAEIAAARLEQFHGERMLLLGGIAAGLAHEIGNPVAGIAAIAAEMAEARRAGRRAECDPATLGALADRLAAITRRFASIAGPPSKELAPIALNAVVENVASLVALDARFRRIAIEPRFEPGLPALLVHEDDLVQLLQHLLVNAAESFDGAGMARPRIGVATWREGRWAVLEVADNGRGMDAQTAARAFEPLFTTKRPGRGNGLGLDACRRIMERHGGRIAIESTPGQGTQALCRFPAPPACRGDLL